MSCSEIILTLECIDSSAVNKIALCIGTNQLVGLNTNAICSYHYTNVEMSIWFRNHICNVLQFSIEIVIVHIRIEVGRESKDDEATT